MGPLEKELALHQYIKIPEIPTFTGGAVGYVAYDCIAHFEPKIRSTLEERGIVLDDALGIPEAVFMIADTVVIYDHLYQNVKVVAHVFVNDVEASIPSPSTSTSTLGRCAVRVRFS